MPTIWELPDDEFYLLCRRIEANQYCRNREQTIVAVQRLLAEGYNQIEIARKLRRSKSSIQKLIRSYSIQ